MVLFLLRVQFVLGTMTFFYLSKDYKHTQEAYRVINVVFLCQSSLWFDNGRQEFGCTPTKSSSPWASLSTWLKWLPPWSTARLVRIPHPTFLWTPIPTDTTWWLTETLVIDQCLHEDSVVVELLNKNMILK